MSRKCIACGRIYNGFNHKCSKYAEEKAEKEQRHELDRLYDNEPDEIELDIEERLDYGFRFMD